MSLAREFPPPPAAAVAAAAPFGSLSFYGFCCYLHLIFVVWHQTHQGWILFQTDPGFSVFALL